jgi:photosystem II stability/assembly factor-like uncharacterized protein
LFLAGFALVALALQAPEREERDLQRQRQDWFYRQRAYPHTYVPAGAHQRALEQLEQKVTAEEAARATFAQSVPGSNPSWTFAGPQPIHTPYSDPVVSGRVTALAIDPGNVNTVYLGSAQGGVWKTTNGGTTWTPLTDRQASAAIGSIALDPSNSSTIYVGTGEENFSGDSYYGAGILKSTNGGTTWTQFCGPFCGPVGKDGYYGGGARIGGLAVHPTNSQILLAAVALLSQDGVYRSANGGNSWTRVLSGNPANSVLFDPTNGNVAYASLGSSFSGGTKGVFKSTNGGQTWTAANGTGVNVLNLTNAGRIVLAMAPSSSTTLYAGIANSNTGGLVGFFKTTDGGANWTRLTSTPDYCTPICSYANVIVVQPTNPNVVFAGGAFTTTLVRSLNGGTTWATLQSAQNFGFLHADMHALSFFPDGNTLYLGNDGGAYVTTQITASNPSFTALNSTLGLTQFYPGLSIHPTNARIAIGGTQDNGTVIYSGALTWNDVVCGDGGYTAIDFITPATMYAACQRFNIFRSTSNGAFGSWNVALNGINTGDRVDFIPPLVMDQSNSQTLYFGTNRVYQTTNGASSWTAISPDLTGGNSFFGVLSTIAVAPNNSNTVYVGTMDNRVQVTTNAASGTLATWTNVSAGLPPRVVTHVAVGPTTSTTAYATFSGFTGFGDNLGHVFKTTNGGSHWSDISGDLPNTPANFLVIDPDTPSTLFVATDVGVFYSTTGGTSWTSLVNGLPHIAVLGLTLHSPSWTLRASTHGRGAWDINIANFAPGPPAVTTNPATNIASFSATLNGTLNPRGSTTTVFFQYGPTASYGSTTPVQSQTGNIFRNISGNISALSTNTTYHFRIVATNTHGTRYGSDRTFTTLSPTGPPVVITSPATSIASFSATLNGSLNPHGLTTNVHFQYGTTTSYGLTTAPQSHTGNTYLNISANISGLLASHVYHFRMVATNSAGTIYGSDRTFTTLTATGAPVVTTNPATNVTISSATLNGSLDPHGLTTSVHFQYGTTTSYGSTTTMQSQTGNTYRNIAANISGLTTHTNYHFRIVATNSGGTRFGSDRTFTTP